MTTPTPEAIEAAARELSAMDDPLGNWHAGSPNYHGVYRRRAQRILSAASPFIAAQALREVAAHAAFTHDAQWLRGCADLVEAGEPL